MSSGASLAAELLTRVPDTPRTLEIRALLGLPETVCEGHVDGAVVSNEGRYLVALWGDPDPALVAQTIARQPRPLALLSLHRSDALVGVAPFRRATVLTLADEAALACAVREARPHVVPLTLEHLAHVPIDLGEELLSALGAGTVTCALTKDGDPAAFAYAAFETERLFDVTVDTLVAHRGHGHATRAAAILIDLERARGREPVWASHDDNLASLAVARKLGMRPLPAPLFIAQLD